MKKPPLNAAHAEIAEMLAAEDARVVESKDLAPLLAGLRSGNPDLQQRAVRALGRFERPSLAPFIVPLLAAPSPVVRAEAATALGQAAQGPIDRAASESGRVNQGAVAFASEPLLERLRVESDPGVRAILCETLGRLPYRTAAQGQRAGDVLLESTRATGAIEVLGAVKGLEALIRLRVNTIPAPAEIIQRLRELAANAPAVGSGSAAPAPVLARIRRLALAALTAASALDDLTIAGALRDPDEQARRLAALAAGAADRLAASEAIATAVANDRSPTVRYEALRAYGRHLTGRDCAPVLQAVADRDAHVSLLAIDLLGDGCSSTATAADTLARLAGAPDGTSWHGPAHALVSLAKIAPDRATALLSRFAAHPVWQVRMYAARAAMVVKAPAALDELARDPHDNVREAALVGLVQVNGHDADPVAIAALERPDYQLVLTAADALKGSPNAGAAVPALLTALARLTKERRDTSRDPRLAMLARLREFGSARHAAALRAYLTDFDPRVAAEAAAILTAWTGRPHHPATTRFAARPVPSAADIERLARSWARVTIAARGTFDLKLLTSDAPVTSARFVRLARARYYDGLTFHRVVPNFVIQGGSPGANEYVGDGPYLRDEVGRPHLRGTVGISTRGRDTGDAQIFINLVDNPRLDHNYTVFAEVIAGLDVVGAILEGDVIERIEIVPRDAKGL